jgi:hypothetical protein
VTQVGIYYGASENGFPILGKQVTEETLPFSLLLLDAVICECDTWGCGSLPVTMREDITDIMTAEKKYGRLLGPK